MPVNTTTNHLRVKIFKTLSLCLILALPIFSNGATESAGTCEPNVDGGLRTYSAGQKIPIVIPLKEKITEGTTVRAKGEVRWVDGFKRTEFADLTYNPKTNSLVGEIEVPQKLTSDYSLEIHAIVGTPEGFRNSRAKIIALKGIKHDPNNSSISSNGHQFILPPIKTKFIEEKDPTVQIFALKGSAKGPNSKGNFRVSPVFENQLNGKMRIRFPGEVYEQRFASEKDKKLLNSQIESLINLKLESPGIEKAKGYGQERYSSDSIKCRPENSHHNTYLCDFTMKPNEEIMGDEKLKITIIKPGIGEDYRKVIPNIVTRSKMKPSLERTKSVQDQAMKISSCKVVVRDENTGALDLECDANGGTVKDYVHYQLSASENDGGKNNSGQMTCTTAGRCTANINDLALEGDVKNPVVLTIRTDSFAEYAKDAEPFKMVLAADSSSKIKRIPNQTNSKIGAWYNDSSGHNGNEYLRNVPVNAGEYCDHSKPAVGENVAEQ